ncbi:unnamed protein product [Prunus armeniaca]
MVQFYCLCQLLLLCPGFFFWWSYLIANILLTIVIKFFFFLGQPFTLLAIRRQIFKVLSLHKIYLALLESLKAQYFLCAFLCEGCEVAFMRFYEKHKICL